MYIQGSLIVSTTMVFFMLFGSAFEASAFGGGGGKTMFDENIEKGFSSMGVYWNGGSQADINFRSCGSNQVVYNGVCTDICDAASYDATCQSCSVVNGKAEIRDKVGVTCGVGNNYVCSGGSCVDPCSLESHFITACVSGWSAVGGQCQPKYSNGTACGTNGSCSGGVCICDPMVYTQNTEPDRRKYVYTECTATNGTYYKITDCTENYEWNAARTECIPQDVLFETCDTSYYTTTQKPSSKFKYEYCTENDGTQHYRITGCANNYTWNAAQTDCVPSGQGTECTAATHTTCTAAQCQTLGPHFMVSGTSCVCATGRKGDSCEICDTGYYNLTRQPNDNSIYESCTDSSGTRYRITDCKTTEYEIVDGNCVLRDDPAECGSAHPELCTTGYDCEDANGIWCPQTKKEDGINHEFITSDYYSCIKKGGTTDCPCPDGYTLGRKITLYFSGSATGASSQTFDGPGCTTCPEQNGFATSQSCCPGYKAHGTSCEPCSIEHNRISSEMLSFPENDVSAYCIDCTYDTKTEAVTSYTAEGATQDIIVWPNSWLGDYQVDSYGLQIAHTACNCPVDRPFVDGQGNCVRCGLYHTHWDVDKNKCVCDDGGYVENGTKYGYLECVLGGSGGGGEVGDCWGFKSLKEQCDLFASVGYVWNETERTCSIAVDGYTNTMKECETNRDCGTGQYCASFSTTNGYNNCCPLFWGYCDSVAEEEEDHPAYYDREVPGLGTLRLSHDDMNYYDAVNWCAAQNKRLLTLSEMNCYEYFYHGAAPHTVEHLTSFNQFLDIEERTYLAVHFRCMDSSGSSISPTLEAIDTAFKDYKKEFLLQHTDSYHWYGLDFWVSTPWTPLENCASYDNSDDGASYGLCYDEGDCTSVLKVGTTSDDNGVYGTSNSMYDPRFTLPALCK